MDKIEIRCPSCERLLRTPLSAAGQNAKCPACGQVMRLPDASSIDDSPAVYDAEDVTSDPFGAAPSSPFAADYKPSGPPTPPTQGMTTSVDPFAAKDPFAAQAPVSDPFAPPDASAGDDMQRRPCPACGEMIPLGAPRCHFCGEIFDARLRHQEHLRQGGSSETNMEAVDWVLCIVCTWVGCIVGIVYLIQGKPKGAKMIGFSILFFILWRVFWTIFQMIMFGVMGGF